MIKSSKKGRGLIAAMLKEDFVFPLPLGFEAPKFIYEKDQKIFPRRVVQGKRCPY
ncbi:MAG: hypothetical protein PUP92_02060 [Rhizonema sp. PD38]|nr:hypothetical protein [Rhizonema sp. PD38]